MTPPPPIRVEEILAQAGWVRALARRLAHDAQSADDLSQGALAAAIERPPRADRPLKPWLARVVTNLARKERRGAARRAERERRHARGAESVPATDLLMAEMDEQRRIARLVAELREPYRSVLLLHYFRDLSPAEIAREQGGSPATVRSQLVRGLALLRERVDVQHGSDPRRALGALLLAAGESEAPSVAVAAAKTLLLQKLILMKSSTELLAAGVVCGLVVTGIFAFGFFDGDDALSPKANAPIDKTAEDAVLASAEPDREPTPEKDARESIGVIAAARAPAEKSTPLVEATEEGPTTFFARAVDTDGQPIAGAEFQTVDEEGVPRELGETTESGSDGRVEILLPKGAFFTYVGHDVSNVYMSLWAPGRARHFFVPGAKRGTRKDLGDITLEVGGSVTGQVIDEGGLPVEGALVVGTESRSATEVEEERAAGPNREGGRVTTRTDARGHFQLDGMRPGPGLIWAGAPRKLWGVCDSLDVLAAATVHGVEILLEPLPAEAAIQGIVVGPAGMPISRATVYFVIRGTWTEETTTVGEDGVFLIPANGDRELRLMATDPSGEFGQSAQILVNPGAREVRLVCSEARTIRIRVVDAASGSALEAAGVAALPLEDQSSFMNSRYRKTDAEGLLELPVPGEVFRIGAGHTNYAYRKYGPFEPDALPEELLVELTGLPIVTGFVLHESEPVVGANIELVESCEERFRPLSFGLPQRLFDGGIQKAVSDEEGRFRVATNQHASGPPVLLVDKQGFALTELALAPLEPRAGVEGVEVEMIAGGALEGRVIVGSKRSPESVVVLISRGDGRPKFTRPDTLGNYRFERLTPGPWRVESRDAEPEGRVFGMAQGEEHPFRWDCDVEADFTTKYDLDLRWQEDLAVVGRLTFDEEGARGWTAELEAPDHADRPWPARPVAIAEDGSFSLDARPGHAKLVLRSPADGPHEVRLVRELLIDQHHGPQNFELGSGGLEGTLPEGALNLRLHHRIDPKTHMEVTFRSGQDGRFSVEGFVAGEASFRNEVPGPYGIGWYGRGSVEIGAGATTQLEE